MEQEVLQLLVATTKPDTNTIRSAELSLLHLYPQTEFPLALLAIASHAEISPGLQIAALTALNNYVLGSWSPQLEEHFKGTVYLNDDVKGRVREQVFGLCTSESGDSARGTNALAAKVVSSIASVDFPEQWPNLFPALVNILNTATTDSPVQGALRVLSELIDHGLSDEQFFAVARDLVSALQNLATNSNHSLLVRAMTLNVFRDCFDTLEMVIEEHGTAVKAFLDDSLKVWMPFFIETIKEPLPHVNDAHEDVTKAWQGIIALKVQVIRVLDKLRKVYVRAISEHVVNLFQLVWEELSRIAPAYAQLFVDGSAEGKLVDGDGLPYTLDALVLEEIDFVQFAIRAPPVRSELQKQMKETTEAHTVSWLQELVRLLVLYARIPQEEEGLWEYDANLYLCEVSSVTANYTPRSACSELAVGCLAEWLKQTPIQAMIAFNSQSLLISGTSWKEKESLLFLILHSLKDAYEMSRKLPEAVATPLLQLISSYLEDPQMFLRAGAQLVLAALFKVADNAFFDAGAAAFAAALRFAVKDEADVVKISCIMVVPDYIEALPRQITASMQSSIIQAVSEFVASHDLREELEDADDVKAALIQTLREGMMLDTSTILDGDAIDLFFTLASDGASNFQLSQLLTETFEAVVSSSAEHGQDQYMRLCAKTIPSVTGAFDVANMTHESALTNLAAELVSALVEFGLEPLPDGLVPAVMPKLQRVLMEGTDGELVRPATTAVSHMLSKGTSQYFAWTDPQGKSALEVTLTIINRLLNSPDIDELAATEVGGLASTLVTKYGADKLGSYLMELLRAVAIRLATAEHIPFIQSLLEVFCGLTIAAAPEVTNFLSELNINSHPGLTVVMTKWLENSIHFAGFDEIRQNVIALSKLFELHDPRIKSIGVKGDLIVEHTQSTRIKTRSQSKQNPDRWTTIPADLKILKILVDELSSAATSKYTDFTSAKAAADAAEDEAEDDDGDDDDAWEDVANAGAIDLGSEKQKQELMAWGMDEGGGVGPSPTLSRARDDETADYLMQWFRREAQRPGFEGVFEGLTDEEKGKLRTLVQ